ncbi:uncharacterized protein LOC119647560 [Hermetia illucens]|uniref:uncharacterized protein LOC119647560 n=1 Tax=Hermetia illucens TaxID=343691 RepID=UPI0018CC224F|nr:uncharacterized protein LOC119647560 [Hermetia illucens]
MYSTTVSEPCTASASKESCELSDILNTTPSLSPRQPCLHTLDDSVPPALCRNYLNRHLPAKTPWPNKCVETGCVICEKTALDLQKTIHKWGEKQFDNKCQPIEYNRNHVAQRNFRIQKVSNEFQKAETPWFIQMDSKESVMKYKKYYCFPKLVMQLDYGFDDYRKIVEYAQHSITIFIINLQYGTRKRHLRTIRCIERAIRTIEKNAYMDIEIGMLAELTNCKLTTGLLNHGSSGIYLDRDSKIVLTADRRFSAKGSHEVIYVNFTDYVLSFHPKDVIKIGCSIEVEVQEVLLKSLVCRVTKADVLKPKMEVFIPEERSQLGKYISTEEDEDISFILENSNCDYIICPCAHNVNVCQYIQWFMATSQRRMFIIGKIKPEIYVDEAVLQKIIPEFSGIWIDSNSLEATPIDKVIVSNCVMQGKFMLRSANYIEREHIQLPKDRGACRNLLVYPDCLVIPSCLPNNVSSIDVRLIIRRSYPEMNDESLEYCCTFVPREHSVYDMLVRQVALNVIFEKASCVIMVNNTGRSAIKLSQNRNL